MAKFITRSFDGSGLLDVYEYYFPGQELDVRVNVRMPSGLLDVWSRYAPYGGHRSKISNYVRECIVMEMLRIDEDMRILSSVEMLMDGDSSLEDLRHRDEGIMMILRVATDTYSTIRASAPAEKKDRHDAITGHVIPVSHVTEQTPKPGRYTRRQSCLSGASRHRTHRGSNTLTIRDSTIHRRDSHEQEADSSDIV